MLSWRFPGLGSRTVMVYVCLTGVGRIITPDIGYRRDCIKRNGGAYEDTRAIDGKDVIVSRRDEILLMKDFNWGC